MCCFLCVCSQFRLNLLSVVFDINASLSDVASLSLRVFSVDFRQLKLLVVDRYRLRVLFLLCLPFR